MKTMAKQFERVEEYQCLSRLQTNALGHVGECIVLEVLRGRSVDKVT